jgi:hypothetical protein
MQFTLDNGTPITTTDDGTTRWPGQNAQGYGRKIRTAYTATVEGRARRVYLCIFGATGSYYVKVKGTTVYVRPVAF